MVVEPYPWELHRSLSRGVVRQHRAALRALTALVNPAEFDRALCELLRVESFAVECGVPDVRAEAPPSLGVDIDLRSPGGELSLGLSVAPALASWSASRLLGRPTTWEDPRAPIDERTLGLVAALTSELVSRSATNLPLVLHEIAVHTPSASGATRGGVALDISLVVEERRFAANVFLSVHQELTIDSSKRGTSALSELSVPLSLTLCVGLCQLDNHLVAGLRPGDLLLPGTGFWPHFAGETTEPTGRAALAAAAGETGLEVELSGAGIVYRGNPIPLPVDVEFMSEKRAQPQVTATAVSQAGDAATGSKTTDSENSGDLEQVLLTSPVVVRIELGCVSLPARDWAELKPGDILETGRPVAGPVTLRVAGKEVAQGQLVSVDGEVGVRVTHIQR